MESLGNIDRISEMFKIVRKMYGLRQVDFAEQLGVRQGTVSKIESGTMAPDLGAWFLLLKAFKVNDPYCFIYSGVEFADSVFENVRQHGSELAPRFNFTHSNQVAVMRLIRPFFDYLKEVDQRPLEKFLKKEKVEIEIFAVLNHPLGFDFLDRFLFYLSTSDVVTEAFPIIALNFNIAFGQHLEQFKSSANLFETFNSFYQQEFTLVQFEKSSQALEYFANINQEQFSKLTNSKKNEFFFKYLLLFPYYLEKSLKGIIHHPEIEKISESAKWKIHYQV